MNGTVSENLMNVMERIKRAARKAGREPSEVTLVVAAKSVEIKRLKEAVSGGVRAIGDNYVQEAAEKIKKIKDSSVKWHLIGHLQRNKVGRALDMFDIIQSVDSERLVKEIAARASKPVPILVEVNTSGETAKFGFEPDKAIDFVIVASRLENIKILGLMTVGPLTDNQEKIRQSFRKIKQLSEAISKLHLPGVEMKFLSMGMSADFEIALEEGSNMIRLGQAIFGRRLKNG
mgnify:CR=1 FL=1